MHAHVLMMACTNAINENAKQKFIKNGGLYKIEEKNK